MEAQLSMTGWVGGEVEFRHTQTTGTSRASFRLACTPRVRRQGSWTDDPTTWMTVICWRSLAEHVASSLGKGEPVLVLGRLRTQAWDDDQGEKHERLVLDATSVGHDLSKGTAAFRRAKRQQPPVEEPARRATVSASEQHTKMGSLEDAGFDGSRPGSSGIDGSGIDGSGIDGSGIDGSEIEWPQPKESGALEQSPDQTSDPSAVTSVGV